MDANKKMIISKKLKKRADTCFRKISANKELIRDTTDYLGELRGEGAKIWTKICEELKIERNNKWTLDGETGEVTLFKEEQPNERD